MAAAGGVLATLGCGSETGVETGPDAPTGSTTTCGNGLCLDLTDPRNQALTAVGGALVVEAPADTLIVIRISATAVAALTDICTHARCGVSYSASTMKLVCPCHGAEYTLTGTVVKGPAMRPLKTYVAVLVNNVITITL